MQNAVAGLFTHLNTFCHNGLPMTVTAAHGTATISSYGTIAYTADPAYRGTDTVTVTASNAHGKTSDPATFTVAVADPPRAEPDTFTVTYQTPFTASTGVVPNDAIFGSAAASLPAGWHAQPGITPPAHGKLDFDIRTGRFTYTPDAGYSGTDGFLYRLEGPDSAVSNIVSVTLTVVVP